MLTIRNLTKRTVVFTLAHAAACSETLCTCGRMKVGVQEHNRETGDRVVRAVNQRVPASVTLFPKGMMGGKGKDGKAKKLDEVSGLQDSVGFLPEIVNAKRNGEIEVVRVADDAPEPEPAPAAPPPSLEPKPVTTAPAASKE